MPKFVKLTGADSISFMLVREDCIESVTRVDERIRERNKDRLSADVQTILTLSDGATNPSLEGSTQIAAKEPMSYFLEVLDVK